MQALSPQRGGDSLFRFAMPDKKSEATAYKKDLIGLFFNGCSVPPGASSCAEHKYLFVPFKYVFFSVGSELITNCDWLVGQ